MDLRNTLVDLRREAHLVRWRVSTFAHAGRKLAAHREMHWPGVKLLLRELARGKVNPSLAYRFQAENDPDRTALVQATSPGAASVALYSYRELNEAIDRVGLALTRRGVGRGSSALLLLKNRVEFLILQPALGRIGGAAVPASWRSTVPEIEYLARHASARIVFFDADIADKIREAIPTLVGVPRENFISVGGKVPGFVSFEELIELEHGAAVDRSEEGSLVMYTSGTTGKPKGAVRTFQRDAFPAALAFIGETPMALGDVHLAVLPLYHGTALGFVTFSVILGSTVVVMNEFRPELFLETVERYRVTTTAIVPTLLHRIVELGPAVIAKYDLSSLRAIFLGGAPLPGVLAIEAMELLGDKVWNFYGATETGIVTLASPADLRASPGTIGRVIPGCEVRLVDEHGRECEDGEVGELYAWSPLLVDGYHADAEATKQSMQGRFFTVGDLARRDAAGRFHIEGRKRDMIISGGVNVYPAEVEAALEAHPAVAEVAVVGVPDREWGERVRAFVVHRPGAGVTGEELTAHCRARLAGPKVPRDFVFLESLPRNPTGKVLKRDLRVMGMGTGTGTESV